jgi:hypothetical protein
MTVPSRRRKLALSSEWKVFPYVAPRKTRTRLMSSFKDYLMGDASFSRRVENTENCILTAQSSELQQGVRAELIKPTFLVA